MNKEPMPLEFESAEERTDFFRKNADYYTITWKLDSKYPSFRFENLEAARDNAALTSVLIKRPVMLYAVIGPYDSWIENVYPNEASKAKAITMLEKKVIAFKNKGKQ